MDYRVFYDRGELYFVGYNFNHKNKFQRFLKIVENEPKDMEILLFIQEKEKRMSKRKLNRFVFNLFNYQKFQKEQMEKRKK